MKVTVEIEIEQLPPNQLLAFYQHIAVAEIGDRTFDVARSLTGLGFSVDEKVNGETLTHTFSINPVIEAVIERLREAGA